MTENVTKSQQAVIDFLRRLNATWMNGRPQDLVNFLHPDVVMESPGFKGQTIGREALIEGYTHFYETTTLYRVHESDIRVNVVDDTAVGNYAFEVVYERDGQKLHSTGRDFWVLARDAGRWQAVWRTMLDVKEKAID